MISPELKKVIGESGDSPVLLTDPETTSVYVLLRAEDYERMRTLCEDFHVRDMYPMMNELADREGWSDPALDTYCVALSHVHGAAWD
jgi:hypothetical protein